MSAAKGTQPPITIDMTPDEKEATRALAGAAGIGEEEQARRLAIEVLARRVRGGRKNNHRLNSKILDFKK